METAKAIAQFFVRTALFWWVVTTIILILSVQRCGNAETDRDAYRTQSDRLRKDSTKYANDAKQAQIDSYEYKRKVKTKVDSMVRSAGNSASQQRAVKGLLSELDLL